MKEIWVTIYELGVTIKNSDMSIGFSGNSHKVVYTGSIPVIATKGRKLLSLKIIYDKIF